MPTIDIPFAQGFYVSESLPISAQRCVNMYPSPPQTETVTAAVLFGIPGIVEKATAGDKEISRGQHELAGVNYHVYSNNLYRVDRSVDAFDVVTFSAVQVNGAEEILGTSICLFADNGEQMIIVSPDIEEKFNAWVYTDAGGLVRISDVDFNGPVSDVIFNDGFFIFSEAQGKQFFISALRDGFDYNALDFGTAEIDPDPIRALFSLKNQVMVLGSQTIESFQNVGGSGFPYQRIQGQVIQKGITAVRSVLEFNGKMVWLGASVNDRPAIWAWSGGDPQKISTAAIENQFRTYTDEQLRNCFAWKYGESGNYFIGFTFPDQTTFVFDSTSGLWHERRSLLRDDSTPYRISGVVEAYGELFVGDLISNMIGVLDKDVFTEYDERIISEWTTAPIDNKGQPFFINSIEAFMESGNALTTGQGSDPKIRMRFSDDGGRTFGQYMERDIGKIGDYERRVVWNQQGRSSRERMFDFQISDPIKRVMVKLEANIDG